MQTQQIQQWFQHHRGRAMERRWCKACGCDRIYTIWNDGNYYCLYCLYRQALRDETEPLPIEPTPATMREFSQMWTSYRRHAQDDADIQAFWARAKAKAPVQLPPAPPPLCEADDCRVCGTCRPHVSSIKTGKRCFHCLMKEGLQRTKIAEPHRPTRDRLDDVARAAVESIRAAL